MATDACGSPLDSAQQQQIIACTRDYCDRGGAIYRRPVAPIEVLFDLSGRCAGQFRWHTRSGKCWIRYNPWVFAADFRHHVIDTVAHEVAHYLVHRNHGSRARPHGAEWKRVMIAFGVEPIARGRYDLSGVPVRRQQRHAYRCGCRTHALSSTLHNRQRKGWRYACRSCGGSLAFIPEPMQAAASRLME